jgi:hypothetical protein
MVKRKGQDAGQAAGQCDDGDLFPPALGDAGGPTPRGGRARIAQAQDRHGRLEATSASGGSRLW